MMEELKKPKSQQDLSKINKLIDDLSAKRKLDETTVLIFKAQIAMSREDYEGAAQYLIQADKLSPNNLDINRMKIQLARANPKIGPAKALEYLERVVNQFGDQPKLRLDKAEILIALNKDKQDKEQLKQALADLLTGVDKWTDQQKVDLWTGIARDYISLNMLDEARQCLNLAADKQPNELPLRLALFSMALDANDADGMKAAQDKILQIVGDKNDSDYLYTEARRRLWLMRRGQLGPDALGDIRSLVTRALDQRPESSDLYALLAEIELMSNNASSALKDYSKAEELGRPTPTAVALHIRLLADTGRFDEAGKLLDRIPEAARQTLLGPRYAEILFQTHQVDEAIKQARRYRSRPHERPESILVQPIARALSSSPRPDRGATQRDYGSVHPGHAKSYSVATRVCEGLVRPHQLLPDARQTERSAQSHARRAARSERR